MCECPVGQYPITMAMLNLLQSVDPSLSGGALASRQLACVMFVLREVFGVCQRWTYKEPQTREKICMIV